MLSFLPSFILAPLNFVLFCLNLAVCGSLIFIGGLLKLLLKLVGLEKLVYRPMHAIYRCWALNNYLIICLTNKVEWQISEPEVLKKNGSYLIIANHQSWLDIMVISHLTRTRTPEPKYFLKASLKKVPFLGMGCWALDMPFMHRYSKSFIAKNPHLKGKDVETTRKSCLAFKDKPTAIINFVEGTRRSPEKAKKSKSAYKHLLTPRAGGIAFTLATLGEQFEKILDISIVYPGNSGHIMMDILKGKAKQIIIDIKEVDILPELIGDYDNNRQFRIDFQHWLNGVWQEKDERIEYLKAHANETSTNTTSTLVKSN